MKHLYFVRHGEGLIHVQRIWSNEVGSKYDIGLSEDGKAQAKACGEDILKQGLNVDLLISSPMKRVSDTAEIIAKIIDYPADDILISDLFTERKTGELEGTGYDTFFEQHSYEDIDKIPGAETIAQLQQRAQKAWEYLQTLEQDTILLVGHSAFRRALVRAIEQRPWQDEYEDRQTLPYATVIKLV